MVRWAAYAVCGVVAIVAAALVWRTPYLAIPTLAVGGSTIAVVIANVRR